MYNVVRKVAIENREVGTYMLDGMGEVMEFDTFDDAQKYINYVLYAVPAWEESSFEIVKGGYIFHSHKVKYKLTNKDSKGNDVYRGDKIKHVDTRNICTIVYEDDCHYAFDEKENMYFKLFEESKPLFEVING